MHNRVDHAHFSRRAVLLGGASLPLLPAAAFALAEKPAPAAVVAAWRAFEREVASGDAKRIIRARLDIGLFYYPLSSDRNDEDRKAALKLLEANFDPRVAQISPTDAAFSRLYWARMQLYQQRAVTQALLPRIRRELQTAAQLRAMGLHGQFGLSVAAATAALIARDIKVADQWLAVGLTILPQLKPLPASGNVTPLQMQALLLEDVSEYFMLCARLSALQGRAENAAMFTEIAIGASANSAGSASMGDLLGGKQTAQQLGVAAGRFAAVVHVPVTAGGSSIIITRKENGRTRSTVHELASATGPSFDDKELQQLLWGDLLKDTYTKGFWGGWQGIYQAMDVAGTSAGPTFQRGLPNMAQRFWTYYVRHIVAALKARGVRDGDAVAFILPHRLSLFPIRIARDPASGMTLNDLYVISEGPSSAALTNTAPGPRQKPGRLAGLFNPTDDLPGAEAERVLASSLFGDGAFTPVPGNLAPARFVDALGRMQANYLYFATHGSFGYVDNPGLSIGLRTRLPTSELARSAGKLPVRLAMLSACESAVTMLDRLTPVPQNVPNLLLGMGAQGVIASLWKVNDDSTALLMHETLRLHVADGLSPPAALRQAQRWLARAKAAELVDYLTGIMDREPNRDWALVAAMAARLSAHEGDTPPFAHPYHWGAFAYYGS